MEEAREGYVGDTGPDFSRLLNEKGITYFSEWGILGDPRESTPELGIKILNGRAQGYARKIRSMMGLPAFDDAPGAGYADEFKVDALPHRADRVEHILEEEMTWKEIGFALNEGWTTIVIPLGGILDHGPFLPVGADTMLGYEFGVRLARGLGKALCAPVLRPTSSASSEQSAGEIVYRKETMRAVVRESCESLATHGFSRIILLPINSACADFLGDEFPPISGGDIKFIKSTDAKRYHRMALQSAAIDPDQALEHGSAFEVALMRSHRPELVGATDEDATISPAMVEEYWTALTAAYLLDLTL